jgi:hypothetical protein
MKNQKNGWFPPLVSSGKTMMFNSIQKNNNYNFLNKKMSRNNLFHNNGEMISFRIEETPATFHIIMEDYESEYMMLSVCKWEISIQLAISGGKPTTVDFIRFITEMYKTGLAPEKGRDHFIKLLVESAPQVFGETSLV